MCAPSTSLDGCGFFNSIVVRLPFNSISDGSECWLFYILVVILIWLCEEVSRVYLCHHLDWKSACITLIKYWVTNRETVIFNKTNTFALVM